MTVGLVNSDTKVLFKYVLVELVYNLQFTSVDCCL